MAAVRSAADALEAVVADDLWPLPTYQEMLYISARDVPRETDDRARTRASVHGDRTCCRGANGLPIASW
jgi:hypothetical protein